MFLHIYTYTQCQRPVGTAPERPIWRQKAMEDREQLVSQAFVFVFFPPVLTVFCWSEPYGKSRTSCSAGFC